MRVWRGATGWRVRVRVAGADEARSGFASKAAAQEWGRARETELIALKRGDIVRGRTFADAVERYRDEITPTKRGSREERLRLGVILRSVSWATRDLTEITPDMIAAWRDAMIQRRTDRGTLTTGATVRRYMTLLVHVFAVAADQWRWAHSNPAKGVKMPPDSPPRTQRITAQDEATLLLVAGYETGQAIITKTQAVGAALVLAIETAMRAGEICALRWDDITGPVARVRMSKTGIGRDVPLSPRALQVLAGIQRDDGLILGMTAPQLDALWRKIRSRAMLGHIHFHDARHEATTRLAGRVDVMTLARITGHKDLRMLMRYYNPTMSEVAARL